MASKQRTHTPNIFGLIKHYKALIVLLVFLAVAGSALNLLVPKLLANGIDAYGTAAFSINTILLQLIGISVGVLFFTYLQSVVQTYLAERVARELREDLTAKISHQSFAYVEEVTSSKLLTNLTSDADAVKQFVSLAVASIISSLFLIVGASILLIRINWKLALAVLSMIPVIGITFFLAFSRMGPLFKKTQGVIDWLNKVINESILGSSLVRVLNSGQQEYAKFIDANTKAKEVGFQILKLFSSLIPIITLVANLAILVILALGGHFVIAGSMSLGSLAAFNSYVTILLFPIFILGFMSSVIGRASASYTRLNEVLSAPEKEYGGSIKADLQGAIEVKEVSLSYGEKMVLKNISFKIPAGKKTAIIGPTAAGKSQILFLLTGLIAPQSGKVMYDGHMLQDYEQKSLHEQIGFVFQDSVMFNLSLKENIAFSSKVSDKDFKDAIETAELSDFVETLPEKLDTMVSERGTSLSGGQKQRVMLARALALRPRVLLLDDFTARVDNLTEQKIISNIHKNYAGTTLVSVTQKISSASTYDHIVLVMEGEVIAEGTHDALLEKSPEYNQILQSQRSTNHI